LNKTGEPFIVTNSIFESTKLMDNHNEFHRSIKTEEALKIASACGLDLVCFNKPKNRQELPLCKIIDFGKWKYDSGKHRKKQKQEHKKTTKELRFSPVISDYDIDHKLKQAKDFFAKGNDVVFFMKLKGRQRAHFDYAEEKMDEIAKKCEGHGQEVFRKKTGNTIMVRFSQQVDNKKVDNKK